MVGEVDDGDGHEETDHVVAGEGFEVVEGGGVVGFAGDFEGDVLGDCAGRGGGDVEGEVFGEAPAVFDAGEETVVGVVVLVVFEVVGGAGDHLVHDFCLGDEAGGDVANDGNLAGDDDDRRGGVDEVGYIKEGSVGFYIES